MNENTKEIQTATPEMGPEIDISVLPTPNPNALKFICDRYVKNEGKATYRNMDECLENPLAQALFSLRGVDNIHFFQNTITVTKFGYQDWSELEPDITETLETRLPEHNPDFTDPDPEVERRKRLPPELLEIEEVLDRTIRPGLQGDGGDLVCLSFENDVLMIRYQGACGSCPSSSMGTLEAIKGILADELGRPIAVYIAPEFEE